MKKVFDYIEPLWLGNDNKISIRRLLAIFFSINLIINIDRAVSSIPKAMKLLFQDKTPNPETITAIGSFLSNISMIILTEASIIAALLSLTTFSNYRKEIIDRSREQDNCDQQEQIVPGTINGGIS